ncbi:methyltransferase family protein [Spirosoma gilvum]
MGYVIILISWLTFGGIHSLTASLWMKRLATSHLGTFNRYYRLLYNGIAVLTFLPVLWAHHMAPVDYVSNWHGSSLTGTVVFGLGLIAMIVALWGYDLAEFIGWPITTSQMGKQELRQNGLLHYVRHPLYTGIILTLLGIWIREPTWSCSLLVLVATLYIRIGIYFEEKKLIAHFGNTYKQYQQRVPMLIPRLTPASH